MPTRDEKRVAANLRFPPDMLRRIDAAAKRRGVSRAAWLLTVASKALALSDMGEAPKKGPEKNLESAL